MTPAWGAHPQFRIVVDPAGTSTTYTNDQAFLVTLRHPENNIASAVLQINDYKNKNYESVFNAFDKVDIYLRYGTDAWTKMMRGRVCHMAPNLTMEGEVLEVGLWGNGEGLWRTRCDTSYGSESENPTIFHPADILDDICDNYVEKQFNTVSSAVWTLNITKIEDVLDATALRFLDGRYADNFTLVNTVSAIATAYAVENAVKGPHWMVDSSDNLYWKTLDSDSADSAWMEFYKDTQAASTLTVAEDMIEVGFKQHMTEYANHIILASNFRMPAYEAWCENVAVDWDHTAVNMEVDAQVTPKIVGTHSIRAYTPNTNGGFFWYPASVDLNVDLTYCGSTHTIPTLNFYARRSDTVASFQIFLHTAVNDYFSWSRTLKDDLVNAGTWYHISLPIGEYYQNQTGTVDVWTKVNNADWADIDYINFGFDSADNDHYVYVDDLHFSGKIIREARDTSEITTYHDQQKLILNDTAIDDTLHTGTPGTTDIGTVARLAYAELLRRATLPLTGMIKIPLAIDFLPGQKTRINACVKQDGTYRIDENFRAIEVIHRFSTEGATTTLNLTNDLTNCHAKGVPTQASLLAEYVGALEHKEAKNLKGSGLDPLIPRLTEDY